MAQMQLTIEVRINRGRLNSLAQQANATIRRTRKGERQAIMHRFIRLAQTCVRVGDIRPKACPALHT